MSTLHFFPFKRRPTTLHSTSLHLSTLNFFPFKLHPTTLHYTCRHFTSSHLNFAQPHFTPLRYTYRHFTSSHLNFAQPHFTPLHYTCRHFTSSHLNFTQPHFTPLHYTCRHFTSSHLNFTQIHFTTFYYSLIWLKSISISYRSISPHITTVLLTSLHLSGHYLRSVNISAAFTRTSDHLTVHLSVFFPPLCLTPLHLTLLKPIQSSGRSSDLTLSILPSSSDPGSETKSFKQIFINFNYSSRQRMRRRPAYIKNQPTHIKTSLIRAKEFLQHIPYLLSYFGKSSTDFKVL